jgi:hypothetical protein
MEAELMLDGLRDEEQPLDCIESLYYECTRAMLNIHIGQVLVELSNRKFSQGVITLKLKLSVKKAVEAVRMPYSSEDYLELFDKCFLKITSRSYLKALEMRTFLVQGKNL